MKTKQIIAMGGGGFSMEPDNPLLDQYILSLVEKPVPAVCFLPTASGDSADYTLRFYRAFTALSTAPSHFSFFALPTADLEDFFLSQDVIYVGGGNTKTMLGIWREWQMDAILYKAYHQGVILAGISAGAICWFKQGLTDSVPGPYTALPCLGFLRGSCSPHYDGEDQRRPTYLELVQDGEMLPGFGIDDSAAVHFRDGELFQVVSSVRGKQAYRVTPGEVSAVETPLETIYLGSD